MAIDINTFKSTPVQQPVVTKPTETNQKNKSKIGTTTKVVIGTGLAALAAVGIYIATKGKVSKTLSEKELGKIQRKFKDLFMRDDISLAETKQMIGRYKEIEKIKDRTEYCKALFQEVNKNYGLTDGSIKLVLKDMPKGVRGECAGDNSTLIIANACPRDHIMNTMHHEFRHAKQHKIVPMYNKEDKLRFDNIVDDIIDKADKNISMSSDEIYLEACEKFLKGKVADKDMDWALKSCMGFITYERPNVFGSAVKKTSYYKNYTEIDARQAGSIIDHVMKMVTNKDII